MKNTNELEVIQASQDGSVQYRFDGILFWANPYRHITHSDNWDIIDQLMAAGLITRKFYRHLWGAEEYTLNTPDHAG